MQRPGIRTPLKCSSVTACCRAWRTAFAALAAEQRGGAIARGCPHTKLQTNSGEFATDASAARRFRLHLPMQQSELVVNAVQQAWHQWPCQWQGCAAVTIHLWSRCPLVEAAGSNAHRRWRGWPTEKRRKASGALSRGRAAGEGAGARRGWRRLNSCGGVCPNSRIWSSTACSTGQGSSARYTLLSRGSAPAFCHNLQRLALCAKCVRALCVEARQLTCPASGCCTQLAGDWPSPPLTSRYRDPCLLHRQLPTCCLPKSATH